jgi:branched-chain amino acid transport system ATP-binding protein
MSGAASTSDGGRGRPLLSVEGASVSYGQVVAVKELSLEVPEASVVALLGPNGAGKSSLLNAICGMVPLRTGRVWFDGQDITRRPAHKLVRRGIRLVPEGRALFGEMSVRENLLLGGHASNRGAVDEATDRMLELFPVLRDRIGQRAGTLSGGEQQMLSIARSLVGSPRLLVLDEPSMGLAPLIVAEIVAALGRLRDEGLTVLVSEQNAHSVLRVADFAVVLAHGERVASGTPAELEDQLEVAYLGTAGGVAAIEQAERAEQPEPSERGEPEAHP